MEESTVSVVSNENESTTVSKSPENERPENKTDSFKKPLLIGKIGQLPRKLTNNTKNDINNEKDTENISDEPHSSQKTEQKGTTEKHSQPPVEHPLPYKEPVWSGLPQSSGSKYAFEVLKSGVIVETINLMEKPFWVFGRLPTCDIYMQHPTISRYHAVLQYRSKPDEDNSAGFYIYDLSSTHGTFLNKNKLRPRVYARVMVGHMIKLGCSSRSYILTGPEEDTEEESDLTITELKQKRVEELAKREEEAKEALLKAELEEEARRKKEEEKGIDWGLGDDSEEEEEADLSENPYAQTNNEELYINDPKKALRGFMEREGYDLEYDCEEQGFGQFLCRVELPLDDEKGRPIVAEVLHKGKKKEAVVQCALEACRILDRFGVLRQATHESRKRKVKDWEQNDYYDSDEDTFLDRTGTIEKKREKRMQAKIPQKPETYESLLEKERKLSTRIAEIEKQLQETHRTQESQSSSAAEEDSLDTFMKGLKQNKLDKQTISKLKSELFKLKQEHAQVVKLANIAKPTGLPPLIIQNEKSTKEGESSKAKAFPIFGKRKKIKVQLPERKERPNATVLERDAEEESEEDEKEETDVINDTKNITEEETAKNQENVMTDKNKHLANIQDGNVEMSITSNTIENFIKGSSNFAVRHISKVIKIMNKLKKLAIKEDRMQIYSKTLEAKKRKILQQIRQVSRSELTARQEHQISTELERIYRDVVAMTMYKVTVIDQVKGLGKQIKILNNEVIQELERVKNELAKQENLTDVVDAFGITESSSEDDSRMEDEAKERTDTQILHISEKQAKCLESGEYSEVRVNKERAIESEKHSTEVDKKHESDGDDESENDGADAERGTLKKKRKKNQKRIQQKQYKAELEKQKAYEEDAQKDGYNMWVPPQDQTGDGRTSLNDKLGY